MKTKLLTLCGAAALSATSVSYAAFSLTLDVEVIRDAEGDPINDKGLLVLVVDTDNNGFSQPVEGAIIPPSSDDEIVTSWDLGEMAISAEQAYLMLDQSGIPYAESWVAGRELALIWFPNMASGDVPSADEVFGFFTDSYGLARGATWALPADETLAYGLKLITSAATKLASFGDFPAAIGSAMYAINNPPGDVEAIADLAIDPDGAKMNVAWTGGSTNGSGYIIQRSRPGSGNWTTVGFAEKGATSFVDNSIKAGLSYVYRVLGSNGYSYATAELEDSDAVEADRSIFANVSARSRILAGDDRTLMSGGLVVKGNDPTKNVILQAIGRQLLGGENFISDPAFEVVRVEPQGVIAENDDWMESDNALALDGAMAIGNAVELAENSKDSAELVEASLNTGYTFNVRSVDDTTGDALLGIFDADSDDLGHNDNRIRNLSARGYLDSTDANSLFVAGTIIRGAAPKEVLVMAWGPFLGQISGDVADIVIEDPSLELRIFGQEIAVATNDDWETQSPSSNPNIVVETDLERIKQVVSSIGYPLYDAGSADALMLVTLPPGAYNFEVKGNDGSGIGLIALEEVELE